MPQSSPVTPPPQQRPQDPLPDATHRTVEVPGGRIHLVEQGTGPLVLMVHGFPESWYSWRYQLPALAAAGYRAVAIDVRGYGRSSKPRDITAYGMLAHVGDNVGVLRALGEETATIVGHDWGAPIAAHSALLRPDLFTAVALLSVPYSPPGGPLRPTEVFRQLGGAEEFYINYFQEPGRAEAEIEPDVRGWLAGVYAGLAGETRAASVTGGARGAAPVLTVPPGGKLSDRFPADTGPFPWLTDADLDFYASEFERTGLTGGLNRYRNVDRDWADLAAWHGAPITQPALFIGGELDAPTAWLADAIKAFPATLPALSGSHVLDGCGHWVQQERPEEVNRLLLDWLGSLTHR
ncbi:epoxide hydrolase [Streptomyces sp. NBRC 110611]|uniref:alpha/beta fold hydrolase n=1 Tax=Streptomyces sp. NBRC 110611 TaxID=1621259 RepID=UPI00082C41A6|nr:alpha/beta hydrolase [Streptomyces sp. NBRC 110611]GAU68118.1 epoxide hydrolase [Streptomyces sp. NBRC 110611]